MNYSSYFQHCYTAAPSPSFEVHPEKVINQDEMDSLCPLDPTTGKRCEPLVRALDPSCSESERQSAFQAFLFVGVKFASLSQDVAKSPPPTALNSPKFPPLMEGKPKL